MMKHTLLLILFCTLALCGAGDAKNINGEFIGETKAKIEHLQKENAELKNKVESLEKESQSVEQFRDIIGRQDARIGDVNSTLTLWSIVVAIWAIIATFISIGIPLFLAFRWKKEVTDEAKDSAQKTIESVKAEYENLVENAKKELNILIKERDDFQKMKDKFDDKPLSEYNNIDADEQALRGALAYAEEKAKMYKDEQSLHEAAMFAYKLKDYPKAIQYWDEIIKTSKDEAWIASALYNKGVTLGTTGESEEEIVTYDEVLRRYKDSKNEKIQETVASALVNKGVTLGTTGESKEAIATYDEMLRRYGDSKNEKIQEQVASALYNKGVTLGTTGESKEEIATYDEVLRRYKDSKNEKIQEQVAKALYNKGVTLGTTGESKEAIKCFKEAIERNPKKLSAYTNLFEMQLLSGEVFDGELSLRFKEYAKNDKNALLLYKMLQILQDSLQSDQSQNIAKLKNELGDARFGGWGWNMLDAWADALIDSEAKKRVLESIEAFKNWDK